MSFGLLAVGTGVASGVALLGVVVLYLRAHGSARAGLAAAGTALALVGPAAGIATASWLLIDTFSGMSLEGPGAGAMVRVLHSCAQAGTLVRIGCGAAGFTLLLAASLGWLGRGGTGSLPAASPRRLFVLALPLFLAPAVVGAALLEARSNRATVIEVVSSGQPGAAPTRPLEDIGEIARRLGIGLTAGVAGFPFLVLVLLGFAAATAILAWRKRVPSSFAALASVFLALQAVMWLAAMLLFRPPPSP